MLRLSWAVTMYYFGAVMCLVQAGTRSVNIVSCKVPFKNKGTSSTDLIILYTGFGGFIVTLMSSILDKNSQILSSHFSQISLITWGGMLATAVQYIIAVVSLNAALIARGPLVIGLLGSCCVVGSVICLPLNQLAVKFTPHFVQKILWTDQQST